MNSINLDNLVKAGKLKKETFNQAEFNGLVRSGELRLFDANNTALALESRFDLAYHAAHAFALAALRRQGYRSIHRYIVFQVLPITLGVDQSVWRILDKCHHQRSLVEYEWAYDVDEKLHADLLDAAHILFDLLKT